MTVRKILLYTEHEKELRKKSSYVRRVDHKVRGLIADLKDTLNAHSNAIGLAAPQINSHQRVVIVCLGAGSEEDDEHGPPIALVNPKIVEAGDERRDFDGCLSFPGLYGETIRPHHLRVTGLDEAGKPFDRVYEGFDAVVVHHEIDHLDGVLFIDRVKDINDLYTVRQDEHGEPVRVPITSGK
ncbi:MAG: peptide deformylase [Anaerolineae bacterium]|nr:peptide deformylase [Anaerolineae bacterium]